MRGKLESLCTVISVRGITPADAGKTPPLRLKRAMLRDHPRGCGENHIPHRGVYSLSGSPPRMRGKLNFARYNVGIYGITPADAGKTGSPADLQAFFTDHPRGCGENFRAGGKAQCPRRITPADAGKTAYRRLGRVRAQDHPRRCGENFAVITTSVLVLGSPPQVRGKPVYDGRQNP